MNALVSIIIPVYKIKEEYLRKCIESVINQSFKDIEIILVDDGSPDNCGAICDEYAKIEKRIKVIHKENGGVSSARNAGLDNAIGEYILFVDADDWVDYTYVEELFNSAKENDAKIAIVGYSIYNSCVKKNTVVYEKEVIDFKEYCNKMISYNLAPWNKIYASELFSDVRFEEGRDAEDVLILPKLITQCNRFVVLDKILYNYRVIETSFTHKKYTIKHLDIPRAFIYLSNYIMDNKMTSAAVPIINATAYKLMLSYKSNLSCEEFKKQRKIIREEFKDLINRAKSLKLPSRFIMYWSLVSYFPRLLFYIREIKSLI